MPSRMAVLTQFTLSRIFQGERGVDTLRPDLRRMAWSVRPTPAVLRAAPVGSGLTSFLRVRPKRWLISSATSQVVALVMTSSSKMWRSSPTRMPKTADMLSTLKSRPIQRGSWGMSMAVVLMFSSLKLMATRPDRFSKEASNS